MFYPQEMTEIELIVPERDTVAVARVLADQGVFHEIDASYLSSPDGKDNAEQWRAKATALSTLERRIVSAMEALDIEEGLPPADAHTVEIETVRPEADQVERDIRAILDEMAEEQKKLEGLQTYIRQLELLAGIDVDVGTLCNLHHVFVMMGAMPAANVARLRDSLSRIPFVLLTLHKESNQAIVMLLGTMHNADVLERAARSAYLNPIELPQSYCGTPGEIIASLREGIDQTKQHIVMQKGLMSELRQVHKQQLQTLLWRVRASRILADAIARFGRLRYTYLITGWVPAVALDHLTLEINQVSPDSLIEANPIQRGRAEPDVPVSLKNPGVLGAFQQLVTIYGHPRYQEIDPTILIALTFPLLFGAMFGDVGHGLILAVVGGILASRKIRAWRGMADLGTVVTICGIVATVFGFLYGSVFGLEDVLPALWIRPLDNIMQILITTIIGGVVLLSLGFILGIINALVARDWGTLIFGHTGLAGALLYWSLMGIAAQILLKTQIVPPILLTVLAVLSGLAVMFSDALRHWVGGQRPIVEGSIATYVVQAVFEMADTLISILSNSLSYVRVGAFAVAHGGLSAVVFMLAEMAGPTHGFGYWLTVILGNLFVIGFEGLIVGIQTLRLEYYEFFSKFFTGGGSHYTPLTVLPKSGDQ